MKYSNTKLKDFIVKRKQIRPLKTDWENYTYSNQKHCQRT